MRRKPLSRPPATSAAGRLALRRARHLFVCIHVATFETLFPFALQEGEQRGLPRSCGAFRCSHGLRSQRLPFIGRLCEKCARLLQAGRSRFGARSGGGRRLLRKGNGCGRVMRRRKKRRAQQARDAPAREMGASLSLLLAASLSASLSASSPSPRRGRFSKFALYLKHGMSKHRPQPTDKPTLEPAQRATRCSVQMGCYRSLSLSSSAERFTTAVFSHVRGRALNASAAAGPALRTSGGRGTRVPDSFST